MATAAANKPAVSLRVYTDCMYFMNGNCKLNDKCQYRHCRAAAAQTKHCFKWPQSCRNPECPYRHPAPPKPAESKKRSPSQTSATNPTTIQTVPTTSRKEGLISFFWDIENVPIPKGQKPFDIIQRIRNILVVNAGLREYSFSCFCNSSTISQENQLSLFHANVRIVHVPDRKPGAVDRQILLELDRFERAHQPPATVVLISGDIDFVGKLSDLRHQAGFNVIVIHNKPAKDELKATVNAHYPWEFFTQPEQSHNATRSPSVSKTEHTMQSYRNKNNTNTQQRNETSPSLLATSGELRTATARKRLYECPKCTSEFESIQALRQHQDAKNHLFECAMCDELFRTLDGQIQHQKAKGHEPVEYSCGICDRSFAKIQSLQQHQRDAHEFLLVEETASHINGTVLRTTPQSIVFGNSQTTDDREQSPAMRFLGKAVDVLLQLDPKIFMPKK